jgi:predicted RNase H-like HicB family nuclease
MVAGKSQEFQVIIEKGPKGCLIASIPELQRSWHHYDSLEKLMERVQQSVELGSEEELEREEFVEPIDFIGIQKISI